MIREAAETRGSNEPGMSGNPQTQKEDDSRRAFRPWSWLAWIIGAVSCAALVFVVTHRAEEKEFLKLARTIRPAWLGLALLLQSFTYVTQGLVWRATARAAGHRLTFGDACKLSLASLFADQALPTAGLSGVTVASSALTRLGMSRAGVTWAVLVDLAMYSLAYALCMSVAIAVSVFRHSLPGWIELTMASYILIRLAMAWVMMKLPAGGLKRLRKRLARVRKLAPFMSSLEEVDRKSLREGKVLAEVFALHLATFLLDTTTLWVAVLGLGGTVSPGAVFISFMAATFFRTIGIVPGGLGTF